jgi:hypothetical protein
MARTLVTALVVSGLGMLALFLAMCLLYGLMYGMTAFIKGPSTTSALTEGGNSASLGDDSEAGARRRAAAIAVALARAELDGGAIDASETDEAASAWWTLHQQNQLTRYRPRGGSPEGTERRRPTDERSSLTGQR